MLTDQSMIRQQLLLPPPSANFYNDKNIASLQLRGNFMASAIKDFQHFSIEEEVRYIKMLVFQNQAVDRNLIEIRTRNWIELGRLLNIHRKKVEAAGFQWSVWAVDHFPFLKQRRREMAMELANFGPRVESYLYMGIDRLYDLLHKLQNFRGKSDFDRVAKRFGYIFKIQEETEETKADKNKQADKIREFFKFSDELKNVPFDKDLLMDVIESGSTFKPKDYDFLKTKSHSPNEVNEFLLKTLSDGQTPTGRPPSQTSKKSIHVILAMLIQSVDKMEADNSYPPISKVLFLDAEQRMAKLKNHL